MEYSHTSKMDGSKFLRHFPYLLNQEIAAAVIILVLLLRSVPQMNLELFSVNLYDLYAFVVNFYHGETECTRGTQTYYDIRKCSQVYGKRISFSKNIELFMLRQLGLSWSRFDAIVNLIYS